ncbi:MAG: type II secretion system F family protein [Candidatus Bathyarchaeota archaeon]|nr:type II secretion system F family protein [Candidatus Bathyarchaeota archaeon]
MGLKERFFVLGYHFAGKNKRITSMFQDLRGSLAKSGIRINFRSYVGAMFLLSTLIGGVSFILPLTVFSIFLAFPTFYSLLYSLCLGVLGFLVSLMFIYFYPSLVASSRGKKIDSNLPFIANAMAILASAGVTPEKIFYSLSKTEEEFGVGREARTIIRNMELLGSDIIKALRFGVKYSPSKNFANLLQGMIENTRSGGDLAGYLRDVAGYYIRETRRRLRDFLETLGFIAEAYVTVLVAGPLMLVVMLSIMSFFGGGFLGFSVTFLLYLVAYVLLPVAVAGVLILLYLIGS